MRIMAKLAGGFAVAVLALSLAACGGDAGSTGSPDVAIGSADASAALPAQPVCDVFSKDMVSQLIGKRVYSASNVDLLAGEQSTLCNYYTDADEIRGVEIKWSTIKDALWDDQVAAIDATPNPTPADMETVRTRVGGLGDDAIKEVVMNDGEKTSGYLVLLRQRGIVLYVTSTAQVSDAALINLTKAVIQTAQKL